MNLPDQYLLSNLLASRVRCDQGIDHGSGSIVWMHPPVHRILGWATKPSLLKVSRSVWSLKQLRAITETQIYVKGNGCNTDQITLERLPTLMYSDLLNNSGVKLGVIADFVFNPSTGKIINYLVARSDPRLPGGSRWRLALERIDDQQPGLIFTSIKSLDELPLARSSIRQDLLKKSKSIKDHLDKLSDHASERLEGWLEYPPWQEDNNITNRQDYSFADPLENWDDPNDLDVETSSRSNRQRTDNKYDDYENDEDPWI